MAWTPTLISKEKHPENPQMVKAVVRFQQEAESIDIPVWGTDLTADYLKEWAQVIIDNLAARDTALASLDGVASIEPKRPAITDLDKARKANRAAMGLRVMANTYASVQVKAAIENRIGELQTALQNFMQANPSVKLEDLL